MRASTRYNCPVLASIPSELMFANDAALFAMERGGKTAYREHIITRTHWRAVEVKKTRAGYSEGLTDHYVQRLD